MWFTGGDLAAIGSPLVETTKEGPSVTREGHDLASSAKAMESSCLTPRGEPLEHPTSVTNCTCL